MPEVDEERLRLAARMHRVTNAFHGFIYFAPELRPCLATIGLPEETDYFASRAAPMGPVPAEVVIASFFNFSPRRVHAALPAAWEIASPETIQASRFDAVSQRLGQAKDVVDDTQVAQAIQWCGQIVDSLEWGARPLAGANAALPLPADPLLHLWQLVTIIREWRGDAHVAALTAAGYSPIECLIAHAATGEVSRSALQTSRGWTDAEWDAGITRLTERGWCQPNGSHTADGSAMRARVEATTNAMTAGMWQELGSGSVEELRGTLKVLSAAVWADMPMPAWTKTSPS